MAIIRDIEKYRERTLARDLIIGLTVAVGFTVAVHIAVYYVYSTTSSERILTEKAESTVDELAEVMAISLWNISRDVIVQISKAYLKSAYLEGIQIKDDLIDLGRVAGVILNLSVAKTRGLEHAAVDAVGIYQFRRLSVAVGPPSVFGELLVTRRKERLFSVG